MLATWLGVEGVAPGPALKKPWKRARAFREQVGCRLCWAEQWRMVPGCRDVLGILTAGTEVEQPWAWDSPTPADYPLGVPIEGLYPLALPSKAPSLCWDSVELDRVGTCFPAPRGVCWVPFSDWP